MRISPPFFSLGLALPILSLLCPFSSTVSLAEEKAAEKKLWMQELTPLAVFGGSSAKGGKESFLFPPLRGVASYTFGWSGLTAARGKLTFSERPGVLRMDLDVKTVGAARTLWKMDAEAFSEVDASTLFPLRMRQWERYRSRAVVTALQFVPGGVLHSKGRVQGAPPKAFFEETGERVDKALLQSFTGEKAKKFKFPEMLDCQAALLWVRQQPLKAGDSFQFVIFQENDAYLAHVRVKPREKITVRGVSRSAIPLEIALEWVDKEWQLRPHTKFKSATGWFTDDADRIPLKLEVEVFVGRIWAELIGFDAGADKGPEKREGKEKGIAPRP